MAVFGLKPWVNPFKKISIFRLFELLNFYRLEKHVFVLEYHKRHFPGLYGQKKNVGEMVIFWPKPWINPLEKFQFFDFSNFLFL